MDYTILGKTGLGVSVLGVGSGGPSGIGTRTGCTTAESVGIVRLAMENGVNFIDTAEAYGTEHIVAAAMKHVPRETLCVSTKVSKWEDLDDVGLVKNIETRLMNLGTDYLDICHFHGVPLDLYDQVVTRLYPALQQMQSAGKIRYIGITERFNADPGHAMLSRAVADDLWDVMMVGFNLLNQSARERVLPIAIDKGVGILAMFAVRLALSRPERLKEVIADLINSGQVTEEELADAGGTKNDPLDFVTANSDAKTLVEAAYRFVRHEDGIHVTLSGSGNEEHMMQNIATAQLPPLAPDVTARLRKLFSRVDSVTAQ